MGDPQRLCFDLQVHCPWSLLYQCPVLGATQRSPWVPGLRDHSPAGHAVWVPEGEVRALMGITLFQSPPAPNGHTRPAPDRSGRSCPVEVMMAQAWRPPPSPPTVLPWPPALLGHAGTRRWQRRTHTRCRVARSYDPVNVMRAAAAGVINAPSFSCRRPGPREGASEWSGPHKGGCYPWLYRLCPATLRSSSHRECPLERDAHLHNCTFHSCFQATVELSHCNGNHMGRQRLKRFLSFIEQARGHVIQANDITQNFL